MFTMVQWHNTRFYVDSQSIYGLKNQSVTIEASVETEDQQLDDETVVANKVRKPYEVTMTAILTTALGISVEDEVAELMRQASTGQRGYLYFKHVKLIPCWFTMISAKASKIDIAANGIWTYAEVDIVLKQSSKIDGSTSSAAAATSETSGGSGDGGGGSVKQQNTGKNVYIESVDTRTNKKSFAQRVADGEFNSAKQQSSQIVTKADNKTADTPKSTGTGKLFKLE